MTLELRDPYLLALYFINAAAVPHERRLNEELQYAWLAQAFAEQLTPARGAALKSRAGLLIGEGYWKAAGSPGTIHMPTLAEQALRQAVSSATHDDMSFNVMIDDTLIRLYWQTGRLAQPSRKPMSNSTTWSGHGRTSATRTSSEVSSATSNPPTTPQSR